MATELPTGPELGDFLDWPPARYLDKGLYENPGKTTLRQELQGEYAMKSAFRFRYEGITLAQGRAFVAELEQAAATRPVTATVLQEAIKAVAHHLLAEPFQSRLFLYDWFSEAAPFLKDGKDLAGLAQHVAYIVDRFVLVEALAATGGLGGRPPE